MNEVCRLFDIDKIRTTPYKPSTNQVERFHRTLNSILAKMVADHQKDWDTRLPFALAAYRATRHSSTGYTPNFLVFGREVRSPADIVYGVKRSTDTQEYDSFVDELRDRMRAAYDQVLKTPNRMRDTTRDTTTSRFARSISNQDNGYGTSTFERR